MRLEPLTDGVLLPVKVVPNARRDQIAGLLGDRLKVRVSAPPEAGKANKAVCAIIARALGLKPGQVSIHTGETSPEKTLRISGATVEQISSALNLA